MFSRASGLPYACQRYPFRLASHIQPCRPLCPLGVYPPGSRFQSATAVKADNNYEVLERHEDQEEVDSRPSEHNLSPLENPDSLHAKDGKTQPQTTYRRWRPHQAENLGVNVLGKPAEVLILPPRKRKIAPVAQEQSEVVEKAEAERPLNSELEPVSLSDVLNNIDALKKELADEQQEFSKAKWDEHRTRFVKGFTKSQLQEYLRISTGEDKPPAEPGTSLFGTISKRTVVEEIMTRAWGWKRRVKDEETPETQPEVLPETIKKRISASAAKLSYILLHENQQLSQISEYSGVEIHVLKKINKVELSGTKKSIDTASPMLYEVLKLAEEHKIPVPSPIQKLLVDDLKSRPLLTMLMHKHKLFIQKDLDTLKIVGRGKIVADLAMRDLYLLSDDTGTQFSLSMYSGTDEHPPIRASFYSDDLSHRLQRHKIRHRYISSRPSTSYNIQSEDDFQRNTHELIAKALVTATPDQKRLSQYGVAPGTLHHEYFIDLGQSLFSASSQIPFDEARLEPVGSDEFGMILHQALLPQVLTGETFTSTSKVQTPASAIKKSVKQPSWIHLRLRPAVGDANLPLFEIVLRGSDASAGLSQHFQVRSASAILDQWRHGMLLPHQPLDMLIRRQSKIDLLGNTGSQNFKPYLGMLAQLGSHLSAPKASNGLMFPPTWKLDISSLLKKSNKNKPAAHTDSQPRPVVEGSSKNGKTATAIKEDLASTYILEPPEYLDVMSYSSSLIKTAYINHIICDTDPPDKPSQRQILRISARPLSDILHGRTNVVEPGAAPNADNHEWVKHASSAAYRIATMLRNAETAAGKGGRLPKKNDSE